MRLLHIDGTDEDFSLHFEEILGGTKPKFAILSHTWEAEEISFKDFQKGRRIGAGYEKIKGCAREALKFDLRYIWVDTCCIDKRSSAELTEAINSMYNWYRVSTVCFAYLTDVTMENWQRSRWFTRGWTLQELLAPGTVYFYDRGWSSMFERSQKRDEISAVTGIPGNLLLRFSPYRNISAAERMSWASNRRTTRIEDEAYCLMGIFDVNMPLLYGEGRRAFFRLQEAIMNQTNDSSLLAWQEKATMEMVCDHPLAISPKNFLWWRGRQTDVDIAFSQAECNREGVRITTELMPVKDQLAIYDAFLNGCVEGCIFPIIRLLEISGDKQSRRFIRIQQYNLALRLRQHLCPTNGQLRDPSERHAQVEALIMDVSRSPYAIDYPSDLEEISSAEQTSLAAVLNYLEVNHPQLGRNFSRSVVSPHIMEATSFAEPVFILLGLTRLGQPWLQILDVSYLDADLLGPLIQSLMTLTHLPSAHTARGHRAWTEFEVRHKKLIWRVHVESIQ